MPGLWHYAGQPVPQIIIFGISKPKQPFLFSTNSCKHVYIHMYEILFWKTKADILLSIPKQERFTFDQVLTTFEYKETQSIHLFIFETKVKAKYIFMMIPDKQISPLIASGFFLRTSIINGISQQQRQKLSKQWCIQIFSLIRLVFFLDSASSIFSLRNPLALTLNPSNLTP